MLSDARPSKDRELRKDPQELAAGAPGLGRERWQELLAIRSRTLSGLQEL